MMVAASPAQGESAAKITSPTGVLAMLFHSTGPIPQPLADAIIRAVLATDAFARVCVDAGTRQIRVVGQLTPPQAAAALELAGCEVCSAGEDGADQAQAGSPCCGSCS